MPSYNLINSTDADRDLVQRVKGFLHLQGYEPHRILEVHAERGIVLVRGRVPTYYLRQVAIECIKRVAGVAHVLDSIDVISGPGQRPTAGDSVEQEELASSVQGRCDVAGLTRTAHETRQTHVRNRQPLPSATEI